MSSKYIPRKNAYLGYTTISETSHKPSRTQLNAYALNFTVLFIGMQLGTEKIVKYIYFL